MKLINPVGLVFTQQNGNIEYNKGVQDCVDRVMAAETIDAIPRETLKNIVYSYKMLDKRFEDLTPFEDSIISLICQIDVQHWKLWAGEYDNE